MGLRELHRRRLLVIGGNPEPPSETGKNTFIGNMADVIPSAASLASKLGIQESVITEFEITGNDIAARIEGGYSIEYGAFSNTNITYYDDSMDGKCSSINGFWTTGLLERLEFKNAVVAGEICRTSQVDLIYLENASSIPNDFLKNIDSYDCEVVIPNAMTLGDGVGYNACFRARIKTVYAHKDLATINAGNAEGDLDYVLTNGGQVFYIDPNENLSAISDLSIAETVSTGVRLSFTPPTSVDVSLKYIVYKDGVENGRYSDPDSVWCLGYQAGEPTGDITVKILYNYNKKTEVSNVVSGTTSATSPVPLSGLIRYMKLDESKGDFIELINAQHGINKGATQGVTAKIGKGISLSGSSQHIEVGNIVAGRTAFTIGFWFKNLGKTSNNALYGQWDNARILIRISSGAIQFYTYTTVQKGGTMVSFSDTSNYHLAIFKYDGATMSLVLDNVLAGTTFTQTGAIASSSLPESIGKERSNYGNIIADEFFAYDRVTTSQEDSEIWNNGNGITL